MPQAAPVRLVHDDRRLEPMRFSFTKRLLEQLKPGDRQTWVYDDRTPGLALLITPADARTFYLAKRMDGRYRRVKIGPFPEVSIEQARKQAAKLIGELASGENPAESRRVARSATTFGDLFTYYLERHAKVHKRTWRKDEQQYNLHLKRWKGRRLNQITRQDVAALHARIGKDHPIGANRLLALLSKIYSVAAGIGYDGANPCRGVQRFPENSRERFLEDDEIPRLLAELDAEPNTTLRDYFKLLLFTGARRGNLASMRWEEIDWQRRVWIIPREKFKTGKEMTVPLVDAAIAILEARKLESDSEWVFPNRRKNPKCPHLREPTDALTRICERAGIRGLKPHDLRRTVATKASELGVPYPVVAKMLGHRVYGVTGVYTPPSPAAIRDGFERTISAMLAAGGDAETKPTKGAGKAGKRQKASTGKRKATTKG